MQTFEKWIVAEMTKVMPKSRIAKALRYTYNIYHKLSRYHLDGRLKIDNNGAENQIRDITLGRKFQVIRTNRKTNPDSGRRLQGRDIWFWPVTGFTEGLQKVSIPAALPICQKATFLRRY